MASQVLGEAVSDRHGAAGQQQLHGHRAANNVGGADDDRIHAVQVLTGAFQQGHDALRRARTQQWDTLGQTADVIRMETIDILVRTNALK
ncbi:hypothetical protein D3C81_1252900 [compost metagenome]